MPRSLTLAAALLLAIAAPARAYDVTQCYQVVPQYESGVLQNDLVCDGSHGPNVVLQSPSHFLLNGHSISGGYIGISRDPGGRGRVVIEGPGEVFGVGDGSANGPFGAGIAPSGKATIRNLTLHDNNRGIVSIYDFALRLDNVTIVDNAAEGIASYFGNLGGNIGPGNGKITGRNVTITGNGDNGIEAYGHLTLRDSTISDNGGTGIVSQGRFFGLQGVTMTGNAGAGIVGTGRYGRIKDSTLTGNGPGGDIAAKTAPKLTGSTCEHSVDTDDGGSLGICTGD